MDLAKRDTPLRARPQQTFRRETTMPRQATDLPGLEVYAQIHRPNNSKAEALSEMLGLVNKVGQKIIGDVQEAHNNADSAQALLDFSQDSKDDGKFAKSRAYRDAWQLAGAKKLAIDVSTEVTEKFNTRLNDPDHPATLEDLDALFEETIKGHLLDEQGRPLDFITPQAKATLGSALLKLKMDLMPQAAKAIKTQQDTKLFSTTYHNMMFERQAGAPIGEMNPAPAKDPYYSPQAPAEIKPIPKGWKGNVEDAIQELGMTSEQAQEFIKTGKDPRKAPAPQIISFGTPTRKLPIQGAITATMADHIKRGSIGVDIDGHMGEPVQAPAGGTVKVRQDAKSGLYVQIDHGNGVVSTYAHLSGTTLKDGEVIRAGQTLGLVGNSGHVSHKSGDGSHLHWRVKVNGKDVNPLTYSFMDGGGAAPSINDGSGPQLASAPPHPAQQVRPGFDVEGFMRSLPPSVDKGEAKKWLIQSLFADAASTGDTSLLNGLENLTRKDGTPSFTPEERTQIVATRDRLQDHARVEADRIEAEFQKENAKSVLQAFVDGKPPSEQWLAEQSRSGRLDENFVYSMVNHIHEQAKQDAREARMEHRQDQAEADSDIDAVVYGMEAERRAGMLKGSSFAEDQARYRNGELGTGKKAAARLLRLQAAAKAGQAMTEQNPEFAFYSGELKTNFKPRAKGDGALLLMKVQSKVSEATYRQMVAMYEQKVHSGEKPGDAYREVVKQLAPKGGNEASNELTDIRKQIEELRRKRGS